MNQMGQLVTVVCNSSGSSPFFQLTRKASIITDQYFRSHRSFGGTFAVFGNYLVMIATAYRFLVTCHSSLLARTYKFERKFGYYSPFGVLMTRQVHALETKQMRRRVTHRVVPRAVGLLH